MPSDTVTWNLCAPSWDSVGVHVSVPVLILIDAPVGRLIPPYVRVLAGMSVSMAVMFSVNFESSCIVWFGVRYNIGGELTSRTVMVNDWESVDVPSDTVT